jgi:hypothetical protein
VGVVQPGNVTLQAGPNTGIPMPNQSGQNALDVILSTTTPLANPITSYLWDFTGAGTNQLSCISNANITASYQQPGLYLTQVTVSDNTAHSYKDVAIVNVLDGVAMHGILFEKWDTMRRALLRGDITTAISVFSENTQLRYQKIFNQIISADRAQSIFGDMSNLVVRTADNQVAECWAERQETDGMHAYPVTFIKDANGIWGIMGF